MCNPKPEPCIQNESVSHAAALAWGQGFASRGLRERAGAQHCLSELLPGPFQASLTLPPWHSFPDTFRFSLSVKANHLQRLVQSHVAVNVVVTTIHSVWFIEQVVFTSVYKVKPPALILHKNKTMGEVHDSEGLVQIFAK